MAEIAVSFVVERMGDLLIQKAMFLEGVHDQVDRLKAELTRMQCFLKDADARQQEDERVRNWVSEIRDLAYQAEDAIDLYISSVAMPGKTKLFPWRIFQKLWNCNKMGKQIEGIQVKLQDIRTSLVTYGINSIGGATTAAGQMLRKLRYISPLVKENIVVGLEEETDELVQQLVGGDERRRVVSIVGMGGLGKTTLAKMVYNDSRVLDHFMSYRAWVYVSEDCRPKDVFQQILNGLPYTPTEAETRKIEKFQENELADFLHEYLKGKRYLVVLDDIWKSEDWKRVARAFPEESHGSRLLLTTRNTEVALQADHRRAPHHMQVLSDEESWKLFCGTAIPEEEGDTETCPPGLEEVGRKMVKKCGGLPLAIVVLGGLLSSKPRSTAIWENVLNNLQVHLACANGVDAVLSLSYVDLPHNLKSCFLYMGLFPEDWVISKRRLLQLWMAEGFIALQEEEDGQRREGRAEEYLNELINRNLVQAAKMSMNERVTKCRIHDLVRDLCIKKAKDLNFFKMGSTSSPRRLGVYHDDWYASTEASIPYIRSLLFFNQKHPTFNFSHRHFKLLRVLELGDVCLTIPTIQFRELIHLSYLRLRLKPDRISPDPPVRNCWGNGRPVDYLDLPTSLQTLILKPFDYSTLTISGRVVQKLVNLQLLSLSSLTEPHEPLRIECLRNLQTLYLIHWRDWVANDTSKLTSLRKLKINVTGRVDEDDAAQVANSIAKCKNLCSLYCYIAYEATIEFSCLAMSSWLRLTKLYIIGPIQKLPEAHEFPPSLTQLTLQQTWLRKGSMVILGKLPKLSTLRIRLGAFHEKEHVLKDGFPQLTNLVLNGSIWLDIDEGGMPKLTRLQIYSIDVYCKIKGLGNLLHLRRVDIAYETMRYNDFAMPHDLPSPSQWHQIESKNEGRIICSFLRK